MTMREFLRWAARETGTWVLSIVLLLAGLFVVLVFVLTVFRMTGLWPWFESESTGDVPAVLSVVATMALVVAAAAFVIDRILRKAGIRPPEAAAVTVSKVLRGIAAETLKVLLFIALMVPWILVWGVLLQASGLRASLYGAGPVWVWSWAAVSMLAIFGATFATYKWVLRRWRRRPPDAQDRG